MGYDEEKLHRFKKSILEETEKKIQKMEQDTQAYCKREIEKAEQKEYDHIFNYMQSKIHNIQWKYKQQVTKAQLESKRNILTKRNALMSQVFSEVEASLLSFTKTKQYPDFLMSHLKDAIAAHHFHDENVVIYLRKEDQQLQSQIETAFKPMKVEIDQTNRLGGFKIINQKTGLLIDETFKSSLANAHEKFYMQEDLTVEEESL